MAYIGNNLSVQQYQPNITYFSGNGSTTAFTLPYAVVSASQIIVAVDNVIQNPSSAYTVSGTTLTFTSAPLNGTNNIWVEYTSLQTSVNNLPANPSVLGPMYVGINGATPLGGATNPIVGASGSANNYVQSYILNQTNGANSSADFTAYPSNGTDAAGWVDMGMTGPTFSQSTYSVTGPNEAYLFGSGPTGTTGTGNLVIATDATGTANAIQFYTNGFNQAKSAARMTIDNSGNVGINTASALSKLSVAGSESSFSSRINIAPGDNQNRLMTVTSNYVSCDAPASGSGLLQKIFFGPAEGYMTFSTANAERMRIDSSGNFIVGTTNAGNQNANSFSFDATNGRAYVCHVNGTASGTVYINFAYNGTGIGNITQNGTTAVAYNTSSDYRLKENVSPMTGALSKVAQLKPVTYTWKADGSASDGFIAHELAEVCPQAVHGQKDAVDAEGKPVYQGIDTSFLVATLTAAIQEQQAIISDLKARIETLEAK